MPRTVIDLKGKTFGRLEVLERAGTYRAGWKTVPLWRCRCECGTVKVCRGDKLRQHRIKSCGCLMREISRERMRARNPQKGHRKMNRIPYEERVKVYTKAIETFGMENQLHKCIEEMAELTKEIAKSFRPGETTTEKLAEECGDVIITLEQLRIMFDINERVCEYMDRKVENLAALVEGSNGK